MLFKQEDLASVRRSCVPQLPASVTDADIIVALVIAMRVCL